MEDCSYVPTSLQFEDVLPGNYAELLPCVKFLYQKLHAAVEQEADADNAEVFCIEVRFLNLTQNGVEQSLQHYQVIPELRVSNTPEDLFKMISRVLNPGFLVTRHIRDQLSAELNDNALNQRLNPFGAKSPGAKLNKFDHRFLKVLHIQ